MRQSSTICWPRLRGGQLLTRMPRQPTLGLTFFMAAKKVPSVFAPVDLSGLKSLLEALWQGAGMELTLIAGERELLQAALYNDPSYREMYQQV